ncbi:MAG: hypothetical protein H6613_14310, partial [Ignavibacteriales bacterium]|nr:hypothetical protein [Ignavibacteriales bacterium]
MKNISQILSLIFLLILTNNAFSQDLSHYLPENPESFQKYENDIYEERIKIFAISDEPLIRDFRVNEQVGNSEKQDVKSAIGDNGISMIVWSDYREGTLNIYGQLISLTGEMIGDNIKINENEDDNNYTYPNVAVNEDNNFLIVWIDGSSGYSVMGQLIDSDGNFIGSNFIIDDENNNSYKLFTSIGCNGKEFAIAWADARNGYTYDIYSQRLNKDVGKIGENFIVHSDSQTVSKTYPDIAIDKNNNLLVTWNSIIEGSYTTFASLVDTSGKIISSSFQLNDSTSVGASNYYPKVAPTDSGFVAVWYRYNAGTYDILGQFVNSSGTKIDSNIIINDSDIGSRNSPTIASDS